MWLILLVVICWLGDIKRWLIRLVLLFSGWFATIRSHPFVRLRNQAYIYVDGDSQDKLSNPSR
jgi:hypothetical protein